MFGVTREGTGEHVVAIMAASGEKDSSNFTTLNIKFACRTYANLSFIAVDSASEEVVGFVSGHVNAAMNKFTVQKWTWKQYEEVESYTSQCRAAFAYLFKEILSLKDAVIIESEGRELLGKLRGISIAYYYYRRTADMNSQT